MSNGEVSAHMVIHSKRFELLFRWAATSFASTLCVEHRTAY